MSAKSAAFLEMLIEILQIDAYLKTT